MIVELLCSVCGMKVRVKDQVQRLGGFGAQLVCPIGHETLFEFVQLEGGDGVSIRVVARG